MCSLRFWTCLGVAFLAAACLPVPGQTPRPSSVTKARGEDVTLEISANSETARAPVNLKWDVILPAQVMDLVDNAPGPAATNSGKTLQCTARKPYAYVCLLSGGEKPILDGVIAIYRFKVKSTAGAGSTTLRIENAEATTMDSRKWPLKDTEAVVIVR